MKTKITSAIEWIHSRLPFGTRPGLERVQALLALVDHPEASVPTIHIAGTNGKGSTVNYLMEMIKETGLIVGTYTSPYIESFNERIAIDGQPISDEALVALVEKYQPLVAQLDEDEAVKGITEFETLTAMALDYFREQAVDVAIIEVGLGGLLDSTNVVQPLLCGITTIGLDHTDILGDTLEKIAAQKAGIIKPQVPVVTGKIASDALAVIESVARQNQAPIFRFGEEYQVTYRHPHEDWGEVFTFQNEAGKLSDLQTSLIGRHQSENAGVAVELFYQFCQIKGLPFAPKVVRQGLKQVHWPGRMERLSEEPLILLDGAHNDHAIERLVETMKKEFKEYQIHILFSALSTKDVPGMLSALLKIPNARIYVTTFDYPKAIKLDDNFTDVSEDRITVVSLWQFGLGEILEKMSGPDELLLVTGSLYFVSDVRKLLLEMGGDSEDD